jgi:hypothetical protein
VKTLFVNCLTGSRPAFGGTFGAILLLGVACAPATTSSTATTTAADVPVEREAANPPKPQAPPGRLLCRAKTAEGSVELYSEGSDGTLRRVVPNGDVETKSVHLEHVRSMVIADERNSTDLAVHAATIREKNGKQFIRLGDWNQPWAGCE